MVQKSTPTLARGSAPRRFVARTVHRFGDLERRCLETRVRVADGLEVRAALEAFAERRYVISNIGDPFGVEQIAVAFERLLGRVDQRLRLISELGEHAAELVRLFEPAGVLDELLDLGL